MRAVAEYVMRGRAQALLVTQALWIAVLGVLLQVDIFQASGLMFAWLSAAALALVTMRLGASEGGYILAWALLPAGFLTAFGDASPLGLILGTTALALVLRGTVSWQWTLCASSLVGVVTGALLLGFAENYLQQIAGMFAEVFANLEAQLEQQGGEAVKLTPPGVVTIAGLLGLTNALSCVLCLLLARWWQATLYNPGGFGEEFHALRFSPQVGSLLVVLMLMISTFGHEYRPWAVLFAIPLCVAGLALVHARAAYRGQGAAYLTLFYVLWILLDPVKMIVLGLAVADSWFDFRSRWRPRPKQPDSDNE